MSFGYKYGSLSKKDVIVSYGQELRKKTCVFRMVAMPELMSGAGVP